MFPAGQTAATYLNFKFCGTGGCSSFADNNIVGWTSSLTRSALGNSGQYQTGVPQNTTDFNSDPMIDPTTPEPIVVRDQNATISQVVSTTAVAGVTYTLDVDLGFEKTNLDDASVYLIVDGNQVLANPLASYNRTQKQMQETGNGMTSRLRTLQPMRTLALQSRFFFPARRMALDLDTSATCG
jgi:hypothetical protein